MSEATKFRTVFELVKQTKDPSLQSLVGSLNLLEAGDPKKTFEYVDGILGRYIDEKMDYYGVVRREKEMVEQLKSVERLGGSYTVPQLAFALPAPLSISGEEGANKEARFIEGGTNTLRADWQHGGNGKTDASWAITATSIN